LAEETDGLTVLLLHILPLLLGGCKRKFHEVVPHLDYPTLLGMGYTHTCKVFVIVHLVVLLNLSIKSSFNDFIVEYSTQF
jgi:hypothetical protein